MQVEVAFTEALEVEDLWCRRRPARQAFLAGVAIAQQFGRSATPQNQAWTETQFGHLEGEWLHLEKATDHPVTGGDLMP